VEVYTNISHKDKKRGSLILYNKWEGNWEKLAERLKRKLKKLNRNQRTAIYS